MNLVSAGFFYTMPVKTKGVIMALLMIGHFFSASYLITFANTVVIANVCFYGANFIKLLSRLKPFVILIILIILFHSILNPDNTTMWLWFGREGFVYGSFIAMRLIAIILLAQSFLITTSSRTIFRYFSTINKDLGVIMFLLIGLIPVMKTEMKYTLESQQTRGLTWGNFFSKIKAYITLVIPVIIKSLYRAQNMAKLLYIRGYGDQHKELKVSFPPVLIQGYKTSVFIAFLFFTINIIFFFSK